MKLRVLLLAFALVLFTTNLKSSDGSPDTTFNGTGFVNASFGEFLDVWVQTNSKIVVVGGNVTVAIAARYNLDGSLDKVTFGSPNGFVAQPNGFGEATIIQPDLIDAKILAAGVDMTDSFGLVTRYNSDGSLDQSFNQPNGFVVTTQAGEYTSIALQTDKKIVVGGTDSTFANFFLARYNPNGSLDPSFGGSGFIIGTPIGEIEALAIATDGKIVVAGSHNIVRYNTDGSVDLTFGVNGIVTFPQGFFFGLNIQPDGKIVGSGSDLSGNFIVARFLPNGNLDNITFNPLNGFINMPTGNSNNNLLQSDGKIIATGFFSGLIEIARYLSTSGLDTTTFGSPNGFVTGPAGSSRGSAFIQNGKIVAAGQTNTSPGIVALYNNNNPLVNTTITSPTTGSTLLSGAITFTGTAQNLSFVYLYLDGNFLAGFPTDASGTNTWSYSANIASGNHTVQVVSIYKAGQVNFQSDPVNFSVAQSTTTLFATKSTNLLTLNALAGNVFSYNITVRNTGTTAATGVILTDSLPDGLTYLSSSISNGGSTSFLNNVITANIGTIAAGGFVAVTINVAINQCFSGSLTNISSIASSNAPTISAINNINVLIPSNLIRAIFTKYC